MRSIKPRLINGHDARGYLDAQSERAEVGA